MKPKFHLACTMICATGLAGCVDNLSVRPENPEIPAIHAHGQVHLLSDCPGDKELKKPDQQVGTQEFASLPAAIVAAILPTLVQKSVKSLGAAMIEAASERQVDGFHAGAHLYVLGKDPDTQEVTREFALNLGCVVIQTGSAKDPSSRPRVAYEDYRSLTQRHDESTEEQDHDCEPIRDYKRSNHTGYWCPKVDELVQVLWGEEPIKTPAFFAVFDVEKSQQRSEMRLIPRFVYLEQSLRDPRDQDKRTVSVTLDLQIPGAEKPFGSTRIDFKDIEPRTSYNRSKLSGIQSHWIALPDPGAASIEAKTVYNTAFAQRLNEKMTARTAAEMWKNLYGTDMPSYTKTDREKVTDICGSAAFLQRRYLSDAHAELAVAQAMATKEKPNADEIRKATTKVTYHDACLKARQADDRLGRLVDAEVFGDSYLARSYDARVAVFEFKERKALKSLGELLTDEAVVSGISTAIVNEVDPVKQQEQATAAAAARLELMKEYETAQVNAQQAVVAYDSAEDGPAKLEAEIDMKAAKRAVNRLADQLGLNRPYPGEGTWL